VFVLILYRSTYYRILSHN